MYKIPQKYSTLLTLFVLKFKSITKEFTYQSMHIFLQKITQSIIKVDINYIKSLNTYIRKGSELRPITKTKFESQRFTKRGITFNKTY